MVAVKKFPLDMNTFDTLQQEPPEAAINSTTTPTTSGSINTPAIPPQNLQHMTRKFKQEVDILHGLHHSNVSGSSCLLLIINY